MRGHWLRHTLALINGPALNDLGLGEDAARSLGRNVLRTRIVGVAAVSLLTGGAVAATGPLAFLGLIVPHLARGLTGPDYRWLVPTAGLAGACLLVSDALGRVVLRPAELQVGVVLAVVGAPVLVAVLRRPSLTVGA